MNVNPFHVNMIEAVLMEKISTHVNAQAGYTGERCETNIDECESIPCDNDGSCIDGVNFYTCECTADYTGESCETNIDECESMPCEHGGSCTDGV